MRTNNGLSIVIPCLNESDSITYVLQQIIQTAKKTLSLYEIVVADNGSTDGTLEKIKKFKNVKILHVPIRGYGAALHYGILSAVYPYVLFADGDASYDFTEIPKFIPAIHDNYDLILGSRLRGIIDPGAMPFLNRYLGTPILTLLIRAIYGIPTSDCNSGMRVVNKSFYRSLNMKNSGMEWASELLIKTKLAEGRYREVSITFHKDKRGRRPHLKRWEDGWRHLKAIILLKSSFLLWIALSFIIAGLAYIKYSVFTTIAFGLFAEFFVMAYLIAWKIQSAVTGVPNRISIYLDRTPLLLTGIVLSIAGIASLLLISDNHLYTKYILVFQVILFDLWLFFIETIKTYLINRLPEKI
jgi:glycosyltransferase involved in cell wall biosynthesis